ncbi:Amine oxidase [Penicillium capsulatum]|uniref:Amine oxidase n=1 Tax=Penicillium capsulatum TaxID=69766 RepID=A0A9W9HQS1_9EURO|nr:Amine oxidase [Penicillium capsulatum]KAJ6112722.1 Amine oxidase [Penicillium capsulatum]
MIDRRYVVLCLVLLCFGVAESGRGGSTQIHIHEPLGVTRDSVHNIHVDYVDQAFEGPLRLVYGDCHIHSPEQAHHELGSVFVERNDKPERFVWVVPSSAPDANCLHAFSSSTLVGRSAPVKISSSIRRRESLADVADVNGAWFDGVAYMKSKNHSAAFVSGAKNASIAIVGGGISGLMTSLLLNSVGMHNWHIYESSGRLGGRIRTRYLNKTRPDQYQYQEMGPMRLPFSVQYADTNETLNFQDHRTVFQLAKVLNKMNADRPDLHVSFIPWVQHSPNVPVDSGGIRMPNGQIPSAAQFTHNVSAAVEAASPDKEAVTSAKTSYDEFSSTFKDREHVRGIATNMYKVHKEAIEKDILHWSEIEYLRYAVGSSANVSDYVAGTSLNLPVWTEIYENAYFGATTWRTVDKGFDSFPRAFHPHVAHKTTLNRSIEGLAYNETSGRIGVSWRSDPFQRGGQIKEHDYAVVAAPFTKVRLWDLPPYSSLLSRAISRLNYEPACKVALHYRSRFWEHGPDPILGGCGKVDVPGVGDVCYPSYKINSTGPGVILASFVSHSMARSLAALSDEEHAALAQRAMIAVHGDIAADQFTGLFERHCWESDPHQVGAFADPVVGQQELYIPAYYQTEFRTVFVGDHTGFIQGWISSALDSAVRGTVQVLLDLGLVDEAKSLVRTWMGRWIKL